MTLNIKRFWCDTSYMSHEHFDIFGEHFDIFDIKAAFTRDRIRLEPVRNWYG